jgi:hypothetical protein
MKVYYVDIRHKNEYDTRSSGPFHDRKIAERAAAGALEAGVLSAIIRPTENDDEDDDEE